MIVTTKKKISLSDQQTNFLDFVGKLLGNNLLGNLSGGTQFCYSKANSQTMRGWFI